MIKFSPLNKELNLFNKYTEDVQKFILGSVNKEVFVIPTLNTFIIEFKGFKEALLESYEKNYSNAKGYNKVKDSEDFNYVRLYQAAMDEGMVFAYNIESQKLGLYSSRVRTLNKINPENKFNKEKTLDNNLKGVIHCMRLDVTYVGNDETDVEIKSTVRDKITPDTHILIPFNVMHTLGRLFEINFRNGKILKVTQSLNGVIKERYLTENPSILSKYNEDGRVVNGESWYFTGVGSLYAPVLGAPSNTVGLSRVDFINIEKIAVVKDNDSLVEVSKGSMESLFSPLIYSWILKSLIDKDEEKALRFLGFLYRNEYIKSKYPNLQADTLKEFSGKILKAIGYLTEEEKEEIKAQFSLTYLNRLNHYENIFNKYESVEIPKDLDALDKMLKEGGYKVTVITSESKLSVMYCTNNDKLLSLVYGDDYKTKYTSIGVRVREVNRLIAEGKGTAEELKAKYNIAQEHDLTPPEINYVENDFVRVKLLFSAFTENEVVDFYRTLKLERIVSIVRIW